MVLQNNFSDNFIPLKKFVPQAKLPSSGPTLSSGMTYGPQTVAKAT